MNNSDTEISELVISSKSAQYTDFSAYDAASDSFPTLPAATPAPVTLNVSIPAHESQVLDFKACSITLPPRNPNFAFGDGILPIAYAWVSGYRGTACIGECR